MVVESASTSKILQLGHAAETMSMSNAISWPQPESAGGRLLPPFWSTLVKQPGPQAGSPNWAR